MSGKSTDLLRWGAGILCFLLVQNLMLAQVPTPHVEHLFHCIGKTMNPDDLLRATCDDTTDASCGDPTAQQITWWNAPTGGATPLATGDTFNPFTQGLVNPNALGCHVFYVQCEYENCTSERVAAAFQIVDCITECTDGCNYFLAIEDAGGNGWDAASIKLSINEAAETEYKLNNSHCGGAFQVFPLVVADGSNIDLSYWNGAFENEHAWQLLDANHNVILEAGYDENGNNTTYPDVAVNSWTQVKADCPTCCTTEAEFTVRITLGDFPIEQSWEIYEGTATIQGPQNYSVNATVYAGMAPGTQINYPIDLDLCKTYTFVAFDGYNDGWNNGTWELISSNLNYGNEITDPLDTQYGQSLVIANFLISGDEERNSFTLPCQNCPSDDIDLVANLACSWSGSLPINEPYICYPNCNHALPDGCLNEEVNLLLNGNPNTVAPLFSAFNYTNGIADATGLFIPVGCHKVVHQVTYCDGIITKCTTNVNIVETTNPTMVCNDLVQVSLSRPDENDDNLSGSLIDDYNECIIEIRPDMVLEMPDFCENEYIVTVLDANSLPLVVYDANGFPLDQNGNPILPGNQSAQIAHDLVSTAQAGQTLIYKVEHKFSNAICWGEILVEDKTKPVLICNNYDLECTHPHAMEEHYNYTQTYHAETELPANIAGGQIGIESNTWIPINFGCAALSEIIQDIEVNLVLEHSEVNDLQVFLHFPSAMGLAPIQLATNQEVISNNTYTTALTSVPDLANVINIACTDAQSTSPETFVTENSGASQPANYGGTWYIQIVDNDRGTTSPDEPYGGGQVTAASISLTCGFPVPYFIYDCTLQSMNLLSEAVVETNCDQSDWNGAQIHRVWQAVDASGNSTTCTQVVNLKAPFMSDIDKPEDATLACSEDLVEPIDPSITGTPLYGCFALQQEHHSLCDISHTYEDLKLPTCGGGFKIIRSWTVINWCSGVTKYHEQIIKVEDQTGPAIMQENIVVSTQTYACTADVGIDDLSLMDNCSAIDNVSASYVIPTGHINGGQLVIVDLMNGEILEGLPLGNTIITLTAQDECYNISTIDITITVEDQVNPIAVCDDELNLSLSSDGTAQLSAIDMDEGSYDSCSEILFEARRIDGCLGTSPWASHVPFECCDVNTFVKVELRVTDAVGNSNMCWKTVWVEDALAPTLVCPDDLTITCTDPALHDPYGDMEIIASDNCNVSISMEESGQLDNCKVGVLSRTWTATDGSAKSPDVSCTQTVTVTHVSDFSVQFPADLLIEDCTDDVGLTGMPTVSGEDCELIAISSEDRIFEVVEDACFKIERVWTVVNWCIYDQNNNNKTPLGFSLPLPRTYQDDGDGFMQYTQLIKVLDTTPPLIECPADLTFCDYTDGCEGPAELSISALDQCSGTDALGFVYKIDLHNDGSVDIVDEGNNADGIYEYGTHLIKWIVEDGCGNTNVCSYTFTIQDCKNPSIVCIHGLALETSQMGCAEIWANDLMLYAFDNCSDSTFVENSVKIRAFQSDDPLTSVMTFCCDDIGTVPIEVWVEDEAGNTDLCITYLKIQDNMGNCENSLVEATVAGIIMTETGSMVDDVMVNISGATNNEMPTNSEGAYVFDNLEMNQNYTIRPEKDIDPLNGISTYDLVVISQHILGAEIIQSPYKLIAADVNNDGAISTFDILQLRQLLLYVTSDFPNNTSWRFVESNYNFPFNGNPWATPFPEQTNISDLSQDQLTTDFIAIKIGDVTGDVSNNNLSNTTTRANENLIFNIADAPIQAGESFAVHFRAKDFRAIQAYQFALNFDNTAMSFNTIKAGELAINANHFGLALLDQGIITSSWHLPNTTTTLEDDAILFSLVFDIHTTTTISNVISLSDRYTKAEAYGTNGVADLNIVFTTSNTHDTADFILHQNTPNPFKQNTLIGFNLPIASNASLTIYDLSGRVLKMVRGDFAKGYNTITIKQSDLNASGLLYYRLETATHAATSKMIVIE